MNRHPLHSSRAFFLARATRGASLERKLHLQYLPLQTTGVMKLSPLRCALLAAFVGVVVFFKAWQTLLA